MKKRSSLGGDAVKLTVSKVIVLFITLITGMLLSRFRSKLEYGTYSQLNMVISLATTIIMMGVPGSLNFFLARAETKEERSHFLSVYYSMSTLLSLVVGAVLVAAAPLIAGYFDNPLIKDFLYYLAILPWTKIICASIENILVVYRKTNFIMIYRWVNSLSLLGIIVLVQAMNWDFGIYMMLYVAVESFFSICVYIIARGCAGRLTISFDKELIKTILKFSIPLGLASMVGTLNVELDKFVIGGFMDTESLAVYTNASKEMPVTIIASSITAVLLPQMARLLKKNENKKAVELWGHATYLSFTIIAFLAFALFVFAPEVMNILYSEKYLDGVSVFRVYSLMLILRCTYFGMILNSKGKTKYVFYSSIGSLVLNLILNYLFYYLFGFTGPAVASFLSLFIIAGLQVFWSAKFTDVSMREIFPWKQLLKSLLINGVFAGVVYAAKMLLPLDKFFYSLLGDIAFMDIGKYSGDIAEAVVLGIVWLGLYAAVMFKSLKTKWHLLNSFSVDSAEAEDSEEDILTQQNNGDLE